MKNKLFHLLYTTLFLVICLTPAVGMLVLGPSEAGANEILASKPKLTEKDGSIHLAVLDETEDYIADRFAFRQELVTLWAKLNADLLHTSVQGQVILGSDGWLYYDSTADDYMGFCADIEHIIYAAANLRLMEEYVHSLGADFVFTIAPNKNSLYPEAMPNHYPKGTQSNADLLTDSLSVSYADLFSAFSSEDEVLYFKTDSHWNGKGAALAADTILQQLGIRSHWYHGAFVHTAPHLGDLYEMLYPAGTETEPDGSPAQGFTFQYDTEPNGGNAIRIETSGSGKARLVCWRDSFGISLHPYLAEHFGKSYFSRSETYDLTEAEARSADAVVIELVERNLCRLWENAPVFPAPVRSLAAQQTAAASIEGTLGEDTDTLQQLLIPADASLADAGSPMYIQADGVVYEACVIFDGDTRMASAYIPRAGESPQLAFLSERNGQLTAHPIILK